MISNRIHFEYTFYNKKTKDALVNVQLSPSSAPAQFNPLVNIGSTQSWGHEVQVHAQLYESRRFGWDVLFTGSHISNKVLDLGIDPSTGLPRILRTASQGGEARDIPGLPINGMWYHAYTYKDVNDDHIIQTSEVQVDTGWTFFGYRVPRDLFSVQNGFDLFNRALRISASFDYKGGYSTQDGANNFQCNTDPFACRETQDPTAPLWEQARAVAKFYGSVTGGVRTKTSARILHERSVLEIPGAVRGLDTSQCGHARGSGAVGIEHCVRGAQPSHVDEVHRHRSRGELRSDKY